MCFFLRLILIPPGLISAYSQSVNKLIAIVPPIATTRATITEVVIPAEGANNDTAPAPNGPVARINGIVAIIPPTVAGPNDLANFTAFIFLQHRH